jgi:hypothetical protein
LQLAFQNRLSLQLKHPKESLQHIETVKQIKVKY